MGRGRPSGRSPISRGLARVLRDAPGARLVGRRAARLLAGVSAGRVNRGPGGIAGMLIAGMLVLAVLHGLGAGTPAWVAGVAGWMAAALLWNRLARAQKLQAGLLCAAGAAGLLWSWVQGRPPDLRAVLAQNHALLAMLVAVSFLRLGHVPETPGERGLPRGPKAFLQSLLGVHFLGAVINMSAVVIMGDRMSRGEALSVSAALLLSRGFSTAALWSPFFAAMATALTYAPGARLGHLFMVGFPLALAGLLLTYVEMKGRDPRGLEGFEGFPISPASLVLPGALGAGVLAAHVLMPGWSVLTVIALLSPVLALVALVVREGPRAALEGLRGHVGERLPDMRGELVLFLSAGVLAVGLSAALAGPVPWIPRGELSGTVATAVLCAMVGLAVVGVHPVISIAIVATLLSGHGTDPDLLAMVFLMAWAVGVASSPLSGLHLVLHGRYGVGAWTLPRRNLRYAVVMLSLGGLMLHAQYALAQP